MLEQNASMDFKKLEKSLIGVQKHIIVTMHARPDADALGSSLALASILNKLGHKVEVIAPTEFPSFLNWLDGANDVILFSGEQDKYCKKILAEADLIFCLDFSSSKRVNNMEEDLINSPATKIIIDHHIDPEDFADFLYLDTTAPATAILIYRLITSLNLKKLIDYNIADSLYSGIMTDTGSFQHSNTTAEAHLITADLIKCGADISKVSQKIYNTNSLNKLRFLGYALTNLLIVEEKYNTAYFVIKKTDWNKFNLKTGDTEGLVNYALSLNNISLAALISDKGDFIRISLRSKDNIFVNELAKKYFNGGGHKNAAGGKSHDSLDDTIKKFKSMMKSINKE